MSKSNEGIIEEAEDIVDRTGDDSLEGSLFWREVLKQAIVLARKAEQEVQKSNCEDCKDSNKLAFEVGRKAGEEDAKEKLPRMKEYAEWLGKKPFLICSHDKDKFVHDYCEDCETIGFEKGKEQGRREGFAEALEWLEKDEKVL